MLSELQIKQLRQKYGIGQPQVSQSNRNNPAVLERLRGLGITEEDLGITPIQNTTEEKKQQGLVSKFSDLSSKALKAGAEFTINPLGKALSTPFVSLTRGIQSLIPGGKTGNEPMNTPFGEVKPIASQSAGEAAGNALEVSLQGTGLGLADNLFQGLAKKLSPGLTSHARKLYQTALKPSQQMLDKTQTDIIGTALKESIKVSQKGAEELDNLISVVGKQINITIDDAAKAGKSINSNVLLQLANDGKHYFDDILDSRDLSDLWNKEVIGSVKRLQQKYGELIPVDKAQEIKRVNQKFLQDHWNKTSPIRIEVKKRLTTGIKEGIAEAVPEISKLNKREQSLLELDPFLEKALGRIGNREAVTALDLGVGIGGGLLPSEPVSKIASAGGLLIFKKIIQNPTLKSQRAIWENKIAENAFQALKSGSYATVFAITRLLEELKK